MIVSLTDVVFYVVDTHTDLSQSFVLTYQG
jgi:hypothetical protein